MSSPSNGATVGSPVHVVASASSGNGIAAIRVWVDNNSVYLAYGSSIDTNVPMSQGSHYVVVQAYDNYGNASQQVMTINVADSATPTSETGTGQIVNVSSPAAGQTVGSPAHFVASATQPDQYPVTAMQIYVDGQLDYSVDSAQLDTYLNLGNGSHNAEVKSWNTAGQTYSQNISFNVGSAGSSAPAPAPTGGAGVTITSPSNGGSSDSPMHVVASAQGSGGIAALQIYLDDNLVFGTSASSLDTNVNAGSGGHNLVVQAWDNNGTVYKQAVSVTVAGAGANVNSLTLRSGRSIPVLGQGTWLMGERPAQREQELGALQLGIDLGLSLIDTAEMYGAGAVEEIVQIEHRALTHVVVGEQHVRHKQAKVLRGDGW